MYEKALLKSAVLQDNFTKREFEWRYSTLAGNAAIKRHELLNKNLRHVVSLWVIIGQIGLPKQYRLFPFLLVTQYNPIAEGTIHFHCRAWRNQEWTYQESFSLMTSFHGVERCQTEWRRRRDTNDLMQHWALPATIPIYLARCFHWYNSGMLFMGIANCFLIGFEACSTGKNLCPVL